MPREPSPSERGIAHHRLARRLPSLPHLVAAPDSVRDRQATENKPPVRQIRSSRQAFAARH